MRYSFLIILIPLFIIFPSCKNENQVFIDREVFEGYNWDRKIKPEFSFEVKDPDYRIDTYIDVRYIVGYANNDIKIKFTETTPSGASNPLVVTIPIKKSNGELYGEVAGNMVDISYPYQLNALPPEAGTYTVQFEHVMPEEIVRNFMSLAFRVEKATLADEQ